ncbi:MAG: hypothetical protein KC731_36765, partial [Myxococcales bacterium]|nr:hypothetical protein [Myxococcales bacterium]
MAMNRVALFSLPVLMMATALAAACGDDPSTSGEGGSASGTGLWSGSGGEGAIGGAGGAGQGGIGEGGMGV